MNKFGKGALLWLQVLVTIWAFWENLGISSQKVIWNYVWICRTWNPSAIQESLCLWNMVSFCKQHNLLSLSSQFKEKILSQVVSWKVWKSIPQGGQREFVKPEVKPNELFRWLRGDSLFSKFGQGLHVAYTIIMAETLFCSAIQCGVHVEIEVGMCYLNCG